MTNELARLEANTTLNSIQSAGFEDSRSWAPIPEEVVGLDFVMNPATDDVISGYELKEGMVVLIESTLIRENPDTTDPSVYARNRILENAHWCRVTKLTKGPILNFIGLYSDDTKRSRMYSSTYCWIVKI